MPASRWNSSILEMLNWLVEENEISLDDLMLKPIVTRVVQSDDGSAEPVASSGQDVTTIPSTSPFCRCAD